MLGDILVAISLRGVLGECNDWGSTVRRPGDSRKIKELLKFLVQGSAMQMLTDSR
jgi:hypothetical protein